ncbi:hypothetical protein ACHAPG_006574 [Botrytis cinerea]
MVSGFEFGEKIKKALSLCLKLQPGSEDVALYEAVIFGHVKIMVRHLLAEGAEAHVRTDERQSTCHHLLMMRPRDEETLRKTPELLSNCKPSIKFDAEEMTSSLMALHMAVRNRNFYGVKWLLEMGADKKIPVTDQLKLLSSGVRVYLRQVKYHPRLYPRSFQLRMLITSTKSIQSHTGISN